MQERGRFDSFLNSLCIICTDCYCIACALSLLYVCRKLVPCCRCCQASSFGINYPLSVPSPAQEAELRMKLNSRARR